MTNFTNRSVRWLTRLLATRPKAGEGLMPGIATTLDGQRAVAAAEAAWCETAGLGATFPASVACRAWDRLGRGQTCNANGTRLGALRAESPQGALAAAIGAASAGLRATAFLSGDDLASCGALLAHASGRRVPLVVHVAAGSGGMSESWQGTGDAGWCQLYAINAGEAIDLALAARLASERALAPVMVSMDGLETGLGAGDVHLPEPALVRELLGRPGHRIKPPTPAQRMLLGEHRAAVHRWHDLDNPLLGGSGAASGGGGASHVFFDEHTPGIMRESLALVGQRTGRDLSPVFTHQLKGARVVFVAMGSVVEQLVRAADELRQHEKLSVGVVGVRQLRPWAGDEVRAGVGEADAVVVLERASAPLDADGALTREVRASLQGAGFQGRISTAVCGTGPSTATMRELMTLGRTALDNRQPVRYLGLGPGAAAKVSPRAQVVLDAVRRDYPALAGLILDASDAPTMSAEPGGIRVAISRGADADDDGLTALVGRMLGRVIGGRVRSLVDAGREPGRLCADRVCAGPDATTPDRDELCDIVLVTRAAMGGDGATRLVRDGGIVVCAHEIGASDAFTLPQASINDAKARGLRVLLGGFEPPKAYEQSDAAWHRREALLGGLIGAIEVAGRVKAVNPGKARAARGELLDEDGLRGKAERQHAFDLAVDQCRAVDLGAVQASPREQKLASVPAMLDRLGSSGQGVHDLATSWALRGPGANTPAATPFDAVPAVPALSAALRPVADPSGLLVAFDPESCAGDGMLWTSCPDGSVAGVALGARSLLAAGMELAGENGRDASALSPLLGKLAAQINKLAAKTTRPPTSVREASEEAYALLIGKMSPPEDRRAALDGAFKAVMDTIGMLEIARTTPFFDGPEAASPGSGEFIVIGCNPDACKSARVSVGACEGRGLKLVERTETNLDRARILWRLFERLPDTSGQTIDRVSTIEGVGPLAGVMLAKTCSLAMAPGDAAEPGSGARLALRSVLAVCEARIQPRVQAQVAKIAELRAKLAEQIQSTLAASLPGEDLDALAGGLETLGREDFDLSSLSKAVGEAVSSQRVDGVRLGRLVEVARELSDLQFRLEHGASGLGRARTGMVISAGSGTLWAVQSPLNPFQGPVTVDATGRGAELARGLCEGQMAVAVESARIMRWAVAELERPGEAAREPARLMSLGWDDLTDEEQAGCPPLLLVGDDESLTAGAVGSLLWLLNSRLPVKVVVLTGAGGRVDGGKSVDSRGSFPPGVESDCGLLAMLGRRAFVSRCSVARGDHLAESVKRAITHPGPALLHIHAPSPQRHGFMPQSMLMQAELAVRSRVHCLFRYDPNAGGVFGSCLDLTGNPDPLETLSRSEGGVFTPIDWAISESRFADQFGPVKAGASTVTPAQMLALPEPERASKVAKLTNPLDHVERAASAELVAFAGDRLRLWQTLQELAGLVTPFTLRVRQDAQRAVTNEHAAEIAILEGKHAQELAVLRASQHAEAVARLRNGLVQLSGSVPASTQENGRT